MKQEFYDKLQQVITECEQHPYKTTEPMDFCNGWEGRVSKQNIGTWTDEEYDILLNHRDKKVNAMCENSRLDCFVYCDRGDDG